MKYCTRLASRISVFLLITLVLALLAKNLFFGCIGESSTREESFFSSQDLISCTIFTASFGKRVLFGNNEDWNKPVSYYWVEPSGHDKFGVVFFGFGNFWPQGGVNEKGLAFDVNALPRTPLNPHPEKPKIDKPLYSFLRTCATVEELIEKVKSYNWERRWKSQVHVADRTGDAVVISAGADGEIAFTRKKRGDGYLLSTNFNLANPKNGFYPCWRYNVAEAHLKQIKSEKGLTVEAFRDILKAVHQQGASVNTLYSNVYDLTNGIIYLYHWHQFQEAAEIDVAEEVKQSRNPVPITTLFSQKTVEMAKREYRAHRRKVNIVTAIAWVWFLLVVGSIAIMIGLMEDGPLTPLGMKIVFLLMGLLFGPMGLWVYWMSHHQVLSDRDRQIEPSAWKQALAESVFTAASYSIGVSIGLASFYLYLSFKSSSVISILARVYLLPGIIGLFLVQVPAVSVATGIRYWSVFQRRYLLTIISFNGCLAGMSFVTGVLAGLAEHHLGMPGPASPLFWGVITLGAFAGVLTAYPFTFWMTRNGFCRWPIRPIDADSINFKNKPVKITLFNSWSIILLSFLLLTGAAMLLLS